MKVDLAIIGARVIDAKNGWDSVGDILIDGGRIADVAFPSLLSAKAYSCSQVVSASGLLALPGVVDSHMHLHADRAGPKLGLRMLAKAGVTTAVDFGGPCADVARCLHEFGVGIDVASLEPIKPNNTVSSAAPDLVELRRFTEQALVRGALGVKIFGSNYPLHPDSARDAVVAANEMGAYVAYHSGSVQHPKNDVTAFEASVELCSGLPVHIPHISSYIRGVEGSILDECGRVLKCLEDNPNVRSESYMATFNGLSARVVGGLFDGKSVYNSLRLGGYEENIKGFEQAIMEGFGAIHVAEGDAYRLCSGAEGLEYWAANDTDVGVSFHVVPALSSFFCAVARRADSTFAVDAFGSDGGDIPRNFTISRALSLVRLGALRVVDVVRKAALEPALLFGFTHKGHLTPGADADVILVEPDSGVVRTTIACGRPVAVDGIVVGSGGRMLTTGAGTSAVISYGVPAVAIDLDKSALFARRVSQ